MNTVATFQLLPLSRGCTYFWLIVAVTLHSVALFTCIVTDVKNLGYSTVNSVLSTLGLDIAEQKSCPPAHVMDWLGIEVNSIDMTLKIPEPKLAEVCEVVRSWETRVTATKKAGAIIGWCFELCGWCLTTN